MLNFFKRIKELSCQRINYLHNVNNRNFYNGPITYFDGIISELNEAKDEFKQDNSVYLEDELGDVFWDYMCLLHSLEQKNMINPQKVFERCYKKFSERIGTDGTGNGNDWQEIKQKQKQELLQEHNLRYGA
ncbi:MAG: MazG nucleotide pyrophosphohydrolase domain-containing protein [Candidatus Gracilibacteria bacterium]|nr:MazG nucleotide pyrophosphohydrolase domain-containing protein [Candidatus Gracilibacteria bacterium]